MSTAAVQCEQEPVILVVFLHPGSLWSATSAGKESRSGAACPLPAVGVASPLVLSLPPGAQGDNLHPTRRSVFLYWGSGPGQSNDWRTGPSPSAGGQDHLLEQEQGGIFGTAVCFKSR